MSGPAGNSTGIPRAQVIGSMLRPGYLKQARAASEDGAILQRELKRVEDRAVDAAIARQEAAGIAVLTDGEMRRSAFTAPLSEAVSGMEERSLETAAWRSDAGAVTEQMGLAVTGKLRRLKSFVIEEYSYARGRARRPVKVTVPSPLMMFPMWSPQHSTAVYRDPFEIFADAVDVVRAEVLELAALGCEHIQVDAPELATLVDPEVRDWYESRGVPAERLLSEGIELIAAVIDGIDRVHFGIHLCRGNHGGMWMAEGGYDYIAQALFERAPGFDSYLLEYDDERSGGFEPLRAAPAGKSIVLGLVSTKRAELEPLPLLLDRVEQAARYFPRELLAVSTQCGFASSARGNPIHEEVEDAKLRLVAKLAEAAWPDDGGLRA